MAWHNAFVWNEEKWGWDVYEVHPTDGEVFGGSRTVRPVDFIHSAGVDEDGESLMNRLIQFVYDVSRERVYRTIDELDQTYNIR